MPKLRESKLGIRSNLKIKKGRPDLTPLVDVLFLLLIFFILSTSFIQISGIRVDLPETNLKSSEAVRRLYVVTVDRNGAFYFNDKEMRSIGALRTELNNMISNSDIQNPDITETIIIRVDKKAAFASLAKVLALAESKKMNAFIATIPKDKDFGKIKFEDIPQ